MIRKLLSRFVLVAVLFISFVMIINAQGGSITYGDVVTDTLNSGSPLIYTFSGNQGDIATVYVIGSNNMQASVSVSNSSGQPVDFSTSDALTPMTNDVRVTTVLPSTDTYILTLNNQGTEASVFTLALSVSGTLDQTIISTQTEITIAPDGVSQQVVINGNATAPQTVTIQSSTGSTDFSALLQAGNGNILAAVSGGVSSATFTLPASNTAYILTIGAIDPTVGTSVSVNLGGAVSSDTSTTDAPPVTDPNVCTVTASVVNVRSGPGTNYGVIGSLTEGSQFIATGQYNGWYNGTYNGQSAWVASGVVTATGNCGNLPSVTPPPAPAPATTEETQNTQPTPVPTTSSDSSSGTGSDSSSGGSETQPTSTPTTVPFNVVSISCRWFQNDGATVDFNVTGAPSATFRIDVRQGSTTYSADRTLNQQGFLNANQRFGQAGNSNYTAYIVYNNVDVASAEC